MDGLGLLEAKDGLPLVTVGAAELPTGTDVGASDGVVDGLSVAMAIGISIDMKCVRGLIL